MMLHRMMLILLLAFAPASALACSPPNGDTTLTDAQITRETKKDIQRSDAIIDALVIQTDDGNYFLKPMKVWKGKRQRLYYVENADCGITLLNGTKVRVLLEGSPFGWMIVPPLVNSKLNTRLYDNIVDTYLGHVRGPNFENGSFPFPPTPK
jgi:hypothetical protein